MKVEVLYHVSYFERELFLLDINGSYTMVYKGSGLNKGRKGRVLPFCWLKDELPRFSEAREGIIPGYIFKEFFYRGYWKSHRKNLSNFHDSVQNFVEYLEEFLFDYDISTSKSFQSDEDFNNILSIAKEINKDMKELIKGKEVFDWFSLAKGV